MWRPLTETVELTRHALSLGVTRVVMLPPFYYKGITDEGLFASYAESSTASPTRGCDGAVSYPAIFGRPDHVSVIERLAGTHFPRLFVGLKDSSGDFANMDALVHHFPGFSVLAGADPLMLPLLKQGGAGCITATSNLVARDLAFIFRHYAEPAHERRGRSSAGARRRGTVIASPGSRRSPRSRR